MLQCEIRQNGSACLQRSFLRKWTPDTVLHIGDAKNVTSSISIIVENSQMGLWSIILYLKGGGMFQLIDNGLL